MRNDIEDVRFGVFSQLWLRDHASVRLKETGYQHYSSVIRLHLVPWFGDRVLSEIGVQEVQEFVARKMESGLSARTVANQLRLLRSMFRTAVT